MQNARHYYSLVEVRWHKSSRRHGTSRGRPNTDNYLVTGRVKLESSTAFTVDDVSDEYIGTAASTAATGSMISAAKLDTQANASSAIAVIDGAIESLASTRATLGSLDSRLAHTASNLVNASAATNEALGKLRDADFSRNLQTLLKLKCYSRLEPRCWLKRTLSHNWFYNCSSKHEVANPSPSSVVKRKTGPLARFFFAPTPRALCFLSHIKSFLIFPKASPKRADRDTKRQ